MQDLLDYAQIRSGKFRKNICKFSVKEAIEEVMLIQERKAMDNNVKLYATFDEVGEWMTHSDTVMTDK